MDVFDRVYYVRAVVGIAAGIVTGLVIQVGFDLYASVSTAMLVGLLFYFISLGIGKSIAKNAPKEKQRKVVIDGVIPFIFLLITFMIITYTALHQSLLVK